MKWIEADPLPKECQRCAEESCDNCEYAGKRWYLSKKDALLLRRKTLSYGIARLEKQIAEIDRELALLEEVL